jgi:hypothetical protein
MSELSHTFYYKDQADLIAQLDAMLTKLLSGASAMEPYAVVRARYPHLTSPAFCNRLKRFKGEFPQEFGGSGRRIVRLFVTRELDAYLGRAAKSAASTLQHSNAST